MRLVKFIILLSCIAFGFSDAQAQCEKLKKKRIYQLLGAAEYDNHRSSDVITSENFHTEEYQINLFKGVVYKLIFDASQMPEGVTISLFDLGKKRGAGKYEQVFSSAEAEQTENGTYEVTLEFPQRKMMVQYEVKENTQPGCVSFVLGYYFKNTIR
ncbi:MAG: hypothetical protein KDD41_05860 [Flavobacteriales bacterium]|nr:hypothetical protein [Flavobacteriales bacterium]